MRLASIDIGSNAIRFQVVNLNEDQNNKKPYKKIEQIRFPLRLGQDVFRMGKLSRVTEEKFVKLMQVFKTLMDVYEVDDYMACATSAMRESENGREIIRRVYYQHGLKIDIIDGNQEADIIHMAIQNWIPQYPCMHIDVGGGSTELNIFLNQKKIASKSFKIGSVRSTLLSDEEREEIFEKMQHWLHTLDIDTEEEFIAIGTGGNINKLFNMSPQSEQKSKTTFLEELEELQLFIEQHSFEERIQKLKMNKDRADVILPASDIYIRTMKMVNAHRIIVPGVGMKDGILLYMMEKIKAWNGVEL
ncbi:phosphatase [Algivirga pacifica]|uniref:Ppx/GppA family phosphatase n=1 Tax=Algivirga pacifica TaxID=1162670 RepID=A0ABP9D8H5_9BACT